MSASADKQHCDPAFSELLSGFDACLTNSRVVCAYGIWQDFTIAYLSPGWYGFAAANGGEPEISSRWSLGANLLTGIHGPLRRFYESGFQRCLLQQRPWEHCYECSSAARYRWYQMMAYPLEAAAGLLIVHALRVERLQPSARPAAAARPEIYVDENGMLHQCSYCRRVRRAERPEVWDWVRQWAERAPSHTSHGICEACYGFYSAQLEKGFSFPQPFQVA